tara:strand:+ start:524 stop:784 length:261 start_codon:yes stop_codon:yes gene_type:complete
MSDELIEICDSCNEPTELIEWEDIIENSYGNGQLVSEWVTLEGSACCHSETTEWPLGFWVEEHLEIALEFGYITQEEYNQIMGELE